MDTGLVYEPSVLVIDDDRRYRNLLELNLRRRGYRVALAADGLEGLNLHERDRPDLLIVDVMLPDIDGYEVCRRVREYSSTPIIMLTAKAEEAHKVRGLRMGADDYVTKPFGAEELLARVEAVLRRTTARDATESNPASFDNRGLHIDFLTRRVSVQGSQVQLTPQEYKLLYHLARNPGRVLVQDELLRRVWGASSERDTELLHTTIWRLRRKIEEDPSTPRYVLTERSVGYLLAGS
jgi:DNA-binding response OmpR family regulator